jgi:hypothetical protein
MRLVKLALISILVLFVVIVGISLFIPSHVRISRAVNITAPRDSVAVYVGNIAHWQKWNHFINFEGLQHVSYTESLLSSDQLQVKRDYLGADTVKTTWRQPSGRTIAGTYAWHTSGSVTVVQWYFDFHLRWYPWEKFGSIIFDKQLGPPMEKSLDNLKKLLENPR